MEKEKIENKSDISSLILNEMNHITEMKNNNNNYENLSLIELKKELNSRNTIINLLNTNNDNLKIELTKLIKNLNDLINENGKFLFNLSEDIDSIKRLEKLLEIRKRDLETSKKINQTFKSQYKLLYNKSNNSISKDKINYFEKEIDLLEKNNLLLNTKIKQMKSKNIINSKELLLENQKYPLKIKNYSEEIKALSHMKTELIKKLIRNKKNLENEKLFFKKLEDIYNGNIKEESEENLIKKINFWMNLIKEDISDNVEVIFSKVEMNKSKVVNEIDNQLNDNFKNQNKHNLFLPTLSLVNLENNIDNDSKKNLKKNSSQDNIHIKKYLVLQNSNSKKSILNIRKLSNLNSLNKLFENKTKKKKLKKSESVKILQKLEKMPLTNSETFLNKYEFNILSDRNYRELLYKKEHYLEINSRIDTRIKDLKKISDHKFNTISSTIKMNQNNLSNLKLQNDLLKKEIVNLQKIYSLTKSECIIQQKILENEKNLLSLNKFTQSNHEISNTGNDILNELNLLNDNKKNNYTNLMMTDNADNKNILINISDKNNEEIINDRKKKLKEIKDKYSNFTSNCDTE